MFRSFTASVDHVGLAGRRAADANRISVAIGRTQPHSAGRLSRRTLTKLEPHADRSQAPGCAYLSAEGMANNLGPLVPVVVAFLRSGSWPGRRRLARHVEEER